MNLTIQNNIAKSYNTSPNFKSLELTERAEKCVNRIVEKQNRLLSTPSGLPFLYVDVKKSTFDRKSEDLGKLKLDVSSEYDKNPTFYILSEQGKKLEEESSKLTDWRGYLTWEGLKHIFDRIELKLDRMTMENWKI